MADSYHIIDGQVVPFHGGRKDTNTGAWRDATPMELQLQAELCAAERALEEAAAALEAAREDVDDAARWRYLRDSKACSLSISHNDHHNMYTSVADTLDEPQGYYSDISDSERAAMIETDTIWTLHVYPRSPVGFNVYHAATLDTAIDQARGKGVADEA